MKISYSIKWWILSLSFLLPTAALCEQFSIAIIPDTQMYAERNPEIFEAQVQWIINNQTDENIIYVAHLGDLKDDQSCDDRTVTAGTGAGRTEWQIVDDAFTMLDNANIPYGVVPGNHDFDPVDNDCPNWTTERPLSLYNQYLGPTRFSGQSYYGDPGAIPPTPGNRVSNSNEDNFTLFGACGVEFIAINLAYKQAANAQGDDAELVWADNLLKTYPNRLGILTSHYFLRQNPEVGSGSSSFNRFGPYGQEVYDKLSDNQNLFMMLSAHQRGEAWRVEDRSADSMQPVQALLADYQSVMYPADLNNIDYANLNGNRSNAGDSGFMRIMRFDTDTGMVNVETFAPPVPFLNRNTTLVSNYSPADGTGMDKDTTSNLSFSFQGYVNFNNCGDTTPDEFSFTNQINAPMNRTAVSNSITVSGIDTPTAISIDGGEYAINGGPFTSQAGTISNGQHVRVRVSTGNTPQRQTQSALIIGTVEGRFFVTTGDSGNDPIVEILPTGSNPPLPSGNKTTCLASTVAAIISSQTCPRIRFNGYTYYAYSYIDNRVALNIVAYDDAGNIVQQTNLNGVRYIVSINVNTQTRVVTFTGQVGRSNTMRYSPTSTFLFP